MTLFGYEPQTLTHESISQCGLFSHVQPPCTQLYAMGNTELLTSRYRLGIVGSRSIHHSTEVVLNSWMKSMCIPELVIVSGLAYGVDILAHILALQFHSPCIVIVAGGLSDQTIYPKSHSDILKKILHSGGLILSEREPTYTARKYDFPLRNRLIAACSSVLWIPQMKIRSGTSTTVQAALELGIPIITQPGDVLDPAFSGNNELIKNGSHVATSHSDILQLVGIHDVRSHAKANHPLITLCSHALSTQELLRITELPLNQLLQELAQLELMGQIVQTADGRWLSHHPVRG